MTHRVAILFHERHRAVERRGHRYTVDTFETFWKERGIEVVRLYGVEQFVPADVLFVHVDLSVVPDRYLEFAARYPVTINAQVSDIRKSRISENLVGRNDDWDGPVIVKADLNFAGIPEVMLGEQSRPVFSQPQKYPVFERLSDVPARAFDDPRLVVERFFEDRNGGLYQLYSLVFFGSQVSCVRMSATARVVNSTAACRVEDVDPHPQMLEKKEQLGFDYGKFDFVFAEGHPVLLDANKTVGAPAATNDPKVLDNRIKRAMAIFEFLPD